MAPDQPLPKRVSENVHEAAEHVRERVHEVSEEVKPKLRGWLHAATAPAGPGGRDRADRAVADAHHPGGLGGLRRRRRCCSSRSRRSTTPARWSPRTKAILRRLDHSNIFLLIAGSYTPFALILLARRGSRPCCSRSCGPAPILGVAFRIFWSDAPRWIYTPIYLALGWVAIFYAGDFSSGGPAVTTLIAVGGGLYTLGGLVYGFKKPDPFPTWFGFHEVFHLLTIAAFVCHYVAASIATYRLR